MDPQLLESLLHQEEGSALDFKRSQYPFEKATNADKSELLKDILAFANSWRQSTAYILIGVEEVKGGRSKVIGVQTHLDDAKLHQFVNHKTQRVVEFSYLPFPSDTTQIGVIEIPLQERPTFLKNSFGKLDKDTVYVRDSSSTRIATPGEIAKMGAHQVLGGTPQLALEWADIDRRIVLPYTAYVRSMVLSPLLPADTFARPRPYLYALNPSFDRDYSENVIEYAAQKAFFAPLGMRICNKSRIPARRIRFVGSIAKSRGVLVSRGIGDPPSSNIVISNPLISGMRLRNDVDFDIQDYPDFWEAAIDFGDIRPSQEVWTTDSLYIGSGNAGCVSLEGKLLGDNLPEPMSCNLDIRFDVEKRAMKRSDVEPFLDH